MYWRKKQWYQRRVRESLEFFTLVAGREWKHLYARLFLRSLNVLTIVTSQMTSMFLFIKTGKDKTIFVTDVPRLCLVGIGSNHPLLTSNKVVRKITFKVGGQTFSHVEVGNPSWFFQIVVLNTF
eukprot:TRINITY_DN4887_c0_g1_i2.p1 TRINITY_DN4887_c0_g1~~TRINITY_DN4887_c0_g1_i2.p1  ORF type:complete len:124 (-),score=14.98 TRINITY_DN4887_c0_g1_i2:645-1016(-)